MRKRNDATIVRDVSIFNRFFPYMMKRRCDSLLYFNIEVDVTNAIRYTRQKKKKARGKDVTVRLFNVLMAGLVRTIALRPALNRFIYNYDFWQRNELSFNFVVKREMTDESPERNVVIKFTPDMTFDEISDIMHNAIQHAWYDDVSEDEKTIKLLLSLPKFITNAVVAFMKWLDKIGCYPKSLRDSDGVHVSAFIANLGSIDIPYPPHHHLFEWGTTSLFVVLGKVHRKKVLGENDEEEIRDVMELGFTIDERIAEGFYFIKSMKIFKNLLENPEELDIRFSACDKSLY